MKKLRIYLDTSVINFLFADDAPDFRRVTEDFFDRHAAQYERRWQMKAKNNNDTVPHPLREVWAWKHAVYRATEGMTTSDALKLMHTEVAAVRKVFGLYVAEPREVNACVAEAPTNYAKARSRMNTHRRHSAGRHPNGQT